MIVVIGAGWAGCAAAVDARARRPVGRTARGGCNARRARALRRARRPAARQRRAPAARRLRRHAGARRAIRDDDSPPAWTIEPLSLQPFAATQPNAFSLTTRTLPASLGLLTGAAPRARPRASANASRRSAGSRGGNADAWRCDARPDGRRTPGRTAGRACATSCWNPLCLAALNTPPDRASAQVFLNVLRETFGAGARAHIDRRAARRSRARPFPRRAARWLAAHGHAVRRSTRTRIRGADTGGVELEAAGQPMRAEAVVVAVGPHQLTTAFAPGLGRERAGDRRAR